MAWFIVMMLTWLSVRLFEGDLSMVLILVAEVVPEFWWWGL